MTDHRFAAILRPLLDLLRPEAVVYAGIEPSADAVRWCRDHGVDLHAVRRTTDEGVPGRFDVLVLDGREGTGHVVSALDAVKETGAPRLVVVDQVERGLEGTPDDRARAICAAVVGSEWAAGRDAEGITVPGLGGFVIAASRPAQEVLAPTWRELELSSPVRSLVRAVEHGSDGELDARLVAAQKVIDRQDRELADLRRRARREDTLERHVRRLQRDLTRLQARRSVRLVLRLAEFARPLFQLRRGQLELRALMAEKVGRWRRWPHRGARRRRLRRSHDFASTDTGRFYDELRAIVAGAPPLFIDRWSRSEEALRVVDPAVNGDRPLVSIIMPTYNRAELIEQAIDTVTDQSYVEWELLVCDDASEDHTEDVVHAVRDERIHYQRLPKRGAAAARNAGLARARGELIAYLDSDNLWHPRFLETMVKTLNANPGRHAAYSKYVDVEVTSSGAKLKRSRGLAFDYERLAAKNFIDLNSLVHRRALYDRFGGFNEDLVRQQDWDLILRFTFLQDPVYVDHFLVLYRRNPNWGQITDVHARDRTTESIIEASLAEYYRRGLTPRPGSTSTARLSVMSWDICRNHFSKAYNVAEAVASEDPGRVQLAGFRFFDEQIFPPYADASPEFETFFLPGGAFPEFSDAFARAVANLKGDVLYVVKPRLPSLGVALLANYHFGRPIVLEVNDLESVVTAPQVGQRPRAVGLSDVDPADPRLLDPFGPLWTEIMEGLAPRVPLRATHNYVLDEHFGGGAFFLRNPKDETWFDPDRYDRDDVRSELGFEPHDRILLFGGMVRRHKGIFEFAEVLERASPRWKLLVVGSRETPDQTRLRERIGERLRIVDPVDRNGMARINLASDAVVLWLDPNVPASHYQMPYKLTDALAMRVPVVANPIGDLTDLGKNGYLRLVPFGDLDGLAATLDEVIEDQEATTRMVDAGRRLFLRQFSYRAVRQNMDLILETASARPGPLPVAVEFAEFFARFREAHARAGTSVGAAG